MHFLNSLSPPRRGKEGKGCGHCMAAPRRGKGPAQWGTEVHVCIGRNNGRKWLEVRYGTYTWLLLGALRSAVVAILNVGSVGDAGFPLIVHVGEGKSAKPVVGLVVDTAGYPRMSSELPVGRCRRGNGSWGRRGLVWGVRDRMGVAGAEQDGTRSGDALRFGDVVLRAQKMPLGLMGSGGLVGTALQCSSSDGPGLSGSCSGRAGVEQVWTTDQVDGKKAAA